MRQRYNIVILLFCILAANLYSPKVEAAHPVLERLMKRYGKKNKIKKLGKRAQNAAMDIELSEYSIKHQHDIIGMEPSWMIEEGFYTDHYFNLLSTLVVGEYDINPLTGLPRSGEAMNMHLNKKARDKNAKQNLNIIESANFNNSRINFLLHLTYTDDFGNNKGYIRNSLLNEAEVFNNLTDSLSSYFNHLSTDYNIAKERTGVYIQFDFGDKKNLQAYINFLRRIHEQLDEEQKMYIVVPANIKRRYAYEYEDINKLLEFADKIVIDATNFDKFEQKKPVPPTNFSPKSDFSIFGTLKKYLIDPEIASKLHHTKAGEYIRSNEVAERRERFAIMLPYYGIEYLIDEKRNALRKIGPITLENFYNYEMGRSGNLKYSTQVFGKNDSIFAMLTIPIEGTNKVRKFYVDDGFTLQNKYFYLKDTLGIDNVAINSISYYKTKDRVKPMWSIIALTYGKEREKLGWIIASYLMGFIPLGFVFSIYKNWEVRNALAKYNNVFTRFCLFFVLFGFLFLTAANVVPRKTVALVIAVIIIGAFLIYIVIKKVLMRSKKYVNIVK
jgi:hypothetical protein